MYQRRSCILLSRLIGRRGTCFRSHIYDFYFHPFARTLYCLFASAIPASYVCSFCVPVPWLRAPSFFDTSWRLPRLSPLSRIYATCDRALSCFIFAYFVAWAFTEVLPIFAPLYIRLSVIVRCLALSPPLLVLVFGRSVWHLVVRLSVSARVQAAHARCVEPYFAIIFFCSAIMISSRFSIALWALNHSSLPCDLRPALSSNNACELGRLIFYAQVFASARPRI